MSTRHRFAHNEKYKARSSVLKKSKENYILPFSLTNLYLCEVACNYISYHISIIISHSLYDKQCQEVPLRQPVEKLIELIIYNNI